MDDLEDYVYRQPESLIFKDHSGHIFLELAGIDLFRDQISEIHVFHFVSYY